MTEGIESKDRGLFLESAVCEGWMSSVPISVFAKRVELVFVLISNTYDSKKVETI